MSRPARPWWQASGQSSIDVNLVDTPGDLTPGEYTTMVSRRCAARLRMDGECGATLVPACEQPAGIECPYCHGQLMRCLCVTGRVVSDSVQVAPGTWRCLEQPKPAGTGGLVCRDCGMIMSVTREGYDAMGHGKV